MDTDVRKSLNEIARHQCYINLMLDIKFDMAVCEIEGWDYKEYLYKLRDLIDSFIIKKKEDEKIE